MFHQRFIQTHSGPIDLLIDDPKSPFSFWERDFLHSLSKLTFNKDVLPAVLYKQLPAVGVMVGQVTGPAPVGLRRFAWHREVPNQ